MLRTDNAYKKLFFCFLLLIFINISVYNTPFAFAVFLFGPPLISYAVYNLGIFPGLMLSLSALVFNVLTVGIMSGLYLYTAVITALIVTVGAACGICMVKKIKIRDTLIVVTLAGVIYPVLYLLYVKYGLKINLSEQISNVLVNVFSRQLDVFKSVYPEIAETITVSTDDLIAVLGIYIPGLIPAVMIITFFIYSAFVFAVSKLLCRKSMISDSFFIEGLDCFYLPKTTAIALVISVIFCMIQTDSVTQMAALNVMLVILSLYMLEGLSLIEYSLKQKNFNAFIRILLILGLLFATTIISAVIPILNAFFVLSLIGISDSSGDFRRLNINKDDIL